MSKALIVESAPEGAGARAAGYIAGSKKEIIVADAGRLLAGIGDFPRSFVFRE